jgi:hypothetical protein
MNTMTAQHIKRIHTNSRALTHEHGTLTTKKISNNKKRNTKTGHRHPSWFIPSTFLEQFTPLVGIESNPGPQKRSGASLPKPPPYKNDVKLNRRMVVRYIRMLERDQKAERQEKVYKPEAWFEVGLDTNTRDFFETLMSQVQEKFKSIDINHNINVGQMSLRGVLEWLMSLPQKFLGFVYGLITSVFDLVHIEPLKQLISFIRSLFTCEDPSKQKYKAEGGFIEENFVSCYEYLKSWVPYDSYTAFLKDVHFVKKSVTETRSLVDICCDLLRIAVQFLNDIFGLNLPIPGIMTEVSKLSKIASDLQNEYRQGDMNPYTFSNRCFILQESMEALLFSKTAMLDAASKERLQYLLRKFSPIVKYCENNINPRNGARAEPLGVCIGGGTGVGKSTFTLPVLLDILPRILSKEKAVEFVENHNDFIFYRHTENEFWDGYKSHNVAIVYDDFGQRRDVAGSPNMDIWEIIRLINNAPHHLHFSDIADKAKHYARPEIVFATTNLQRFHFESITCSEAVTRRFAVAMVQYPLEQYCVQPVPTELFERRVDLDRVRKDFPYVTTEVETLFCKGVIEFLEWDYLKGKARKGAMPMNFDQLVLHCVNKYTAIKNKGQDLIRYMQWTKENAFKATYGDKTERIGDEVFKPEMGDAKEVREVEPPIVIQPGDSFVKEDFVDIMMGWLDEVKDECKRVYRALPKLPCFHGCEGKCNCNSRLFFLAALFYGVYQVLKVGTRLSYYLFGENEPQGENSGGSGRNPNQVRAVARAKKGNAIKLARKLKMAHIAYNTEGNVIDSLIVKLQRNTYAVRVRGSRLGTCLFVSSRHFVWPRHFSDRLLELVEVDENGDWQEKISFEDEKTGQTAFVLDYNSDIYVANPAGDVDMQYCYVLNDKIRLHSDIRKHLLTHEEKLKLDNTYSAVLPVVRDANRVWMTVKLTIGDPVPYSYGDADYVSRDLVYHANTVAGDCGACVYITDSRIRGARIAGFHTAGGTSGLFREKPCAGVSITREEIDVFMNQVEVEFQPELTIVDEAEVYEIESSPIQDFPVLCKMKQPFLPRKTKLVRSVFYGSLWDVATAPAALNRGTVDGVVYDPLVIARSKYAHPEVFIDSEVLDLNYQYITNLVIRRFVPEPHPPRLLTFDEAVMGIDGLDYVDSINRTSSPGYPHVLQTGGKRGKTYWFGTGDSFDLATVEAVKLRDDVEETIEKASKGIRSFHIFMDCLKDERRSKEKVESFSTRQFMCCPIDLLIAMKMYFGDFIRHCMSNRIFNGMGVGIDPHDEWPNLVAYMTSGRQRKFTAGDYSKFDAKIPVAIGYQVLRIVEDFYHNSTQCDRDVRRVLFQEIINSRHLSEGHVYEFLGGNPSGQPFTTIFNSISNLLILSYAACMHYKIENRLIWDQEWSVILRRTRFQTFGDDNIISYVPEDESWWSQVSLEKSIPLYTGMDYTNEMKTTESVNSRDITDISFLKRGFLYDGARWRAPLELGVIKETLNWQLRTSTQEEMRLRIESVLTELAQHGKKTFSEFAPLVVRRSLEFCEYKPVNSEYLAARDSLQSLAY